MSVKKDRLVRQIGVLQLIAYYFSTVVGVGIFIVPVFAARLAGPASVIAWILVLAFAYPLAVIYAHISERYQVSGSIQKFIEDSLSERSGRSMALFLVITALFGNCLLGFSCARYIVEVFDIKDNNLFFIIGVAVLILPIFFNLLNIGLSSKIQTITLITLVIIIELIVLTSIPYYNLDNLEPFAPNGYGSVLPAIVICFYSVVGWENVDAMAEEVESPVKTYRKAIKIAVALVALFYLSIVGTVLLALDMKDITNGNAILTVILNKTLGKEAGVVGAVIAIILLILGANSWIMGTSRLIFALSRDKILPKYLSVLGKNHIPYNAVLIQIIFYVLIACSMCYASLTEETIIEIAGLNYLMLYSVVFFCGVKNFTTPRLKFLSLFSLLIALFFLIQSTNSNLTFSLIVLLSCFCYIYFIKSKTIRS
jgi:amino acid efflux transporter